MPILPARFARSFAPPSYKLFKVGGFTLGGFYLEDRKKVEFEWLAALAGMEANDVEEALMRLMYCSQQARAGSFALTILTPFCSASCRCLSKALAHATTFDDWG